MGVLWSKIWFDLWNNKTRTLLAVLSITAGVFAVGAMFGMGDLLITNMDKSHHAVTPTHVNVFLRQPVDRETILALRSVEGVDDVEPYNTINILYKIHPEDSWRPGVFQMRDVYEAQKYELLQLRQGHWPASKDEVAVERMAAQFLNIGIGDRVIYKIDDKEYVLPITGFIRHPFVPPPQFQDLAFFFVSAKGMERFGNIPEGKFLSFYMRVTPYSVDYSHQVASAVKSKLAKQGISVMAFTYEDPDKHWGRAFFDGIVFVIKVLALILVAISAVLVYNTLSNLIMQQINQIGILKAIGARAGTIVAMYLFSALVYGALALIVALPLGAIVASQLSIIFLGFFNIDAPPFEISREAVFYQVASALIAPLLAGSPPVIQGARITVRQAIASYGLGGDYRSGWIDRFVEWIGQRFLPSYYATALGNMFRRKGRLFLTQFVLIAAGSAFLMVRSLDSSLALTLDTFYLRQDYESTLVFENLEKAGRVAEIAKSVQGVEEVELQLAQSASIYVKGQLTKEAGIGANIRGIPEGSDFFKPLIVAGRWLAAGDGRVIVISRDAAQKNNISVGDTVTLDLGIMGKDVWQVVGFYEPVFVGNFVMESIYAPQDALYRATKKFNQGTFLLIRTTSTDATFTATTTKNLKARFDKANMKVGDTQTQAALRATNEWQFGTVTWMLVALSVIVAIVGAIALMGALSIGVIERTKEIGVMRAVGARSRTILGVFIMEGVLQGILSWLIAIPISYVASPAFARTLGLAMFGATMDYQYSWSAVGLWFVLIVVISIFASLFPARSATRISVRDSLAYA